MTKLNTPKSSEPLQPLQCLRQPLSSWLTLWFAQYASSESTDSKDVEGDDINVHLADIKHEGPVLFQQGTI